MLKNLRSNLLTALRTLLAGSCTTSFKVPFEGTIPIFKNDQESIRFVSDVSNDNFKNLWQKISLIVEIWTSCQQLNMQVLCRFILFHSHVLLDLCVVIAAPDETLGGIQRVVGVGHSLPLGGHAHQSLSISCECHNRGRGPRALCIL